MFFFDELQDLAVTGIVELVRVVIEGPMARQNRATLVMFITNAQRDALFSRLTTTFRGVIAKVLHGMVLHHDLNYVGGIVVQNLQPMLVAFLHMGDGPLLEVP